VPVDVFRFVDRVRDIVYRRVLLSGENNFFYCPFESTREKNPVVFLLRSRDAKLARVKTPRYCYRVGPTAGNRLKQLQLISTEIEQRVTMSLRVQKI